MSELDRWENEGGAANTARPTVPMWALEGNHTQLDQKIAAELKRLNPCGEELSRLKRAKLDLKDQIRQLGA